VGHPGTYLGFIDKIPYLQDLGINAVELLPIHEIYVEDFLHERGLTNYWGYNTLGFFAPESSYSTRSWPGCAVAEWKTMVRQLRCAAFACSTPPAAKAMAVFCSRTLQLALRESISLPTRLPTRASVIRGTISSSLTAP
jgi:hypothetical protein